MFIDLDRSKLSFSAVGAKCCFVHTARRKIPVIFAINIQPLMGYLSLG